MERRVILIFFLFLSCGFSPRKKAFGILLEGTKNESIVVQVSAAKGLRQIGHAQGEKILNRILQGDDNNGIVLALAALHDLGENEFSSTVAKLTQHSDQLIRTEAFKVISSIDDERCREILMRGTDDKIVKIRKFSYSGLQKFRATEELLNGLRDDDPLIRIIAAEALGSIGEKGLTDFIRNELKRCSTNTRKQGIISLAVIGDTSAIVIVEEALADTLRELKLAAAEALLILNNKDGVVLLQEGIESDDPFTREEVVQILKRHQIAEGVDILKKALKDEYTNISVLAIDALAEYKMQENEQIFQEMMDAPNRLVQIAAATAYLRNN